MPQTSPPPTSQQPQQQQQQQFTVDAEVEKLYSLGKLLGKGAYGFVFAATDKKSGKEVAIKIIPKNKAGISKEKVEKEITIMRDLNHPRILRMFNYIPTEANYNIVMEKVDGGELLAQMLKLKRYTERKACRVMFNLLNALKHMHERKWMHCDLKPENLLLVKPPTSDEEVTSIKLADFGLSRSVRPNELPRTACGSPLYIAPEVLLAGIKRTRPNYDEKADLWSAGIICFLLLTGMIPFFGKTPDEIFNVVLTTRHNFNHKTWEPISDEAKDFVNRLLVKEPEHRMSAAQALRHPWMKLSAGPDNDEDVDLPEAVEGLRQFNAQQKLKGTIYGVEAMFKLAYLSKCTFVNVKPNSNILAKLSQYANIDFDLEDSINQPNRVGGGGGGEAIDEGDSSVAALKLQASLSSVGSGGERVHNRRTTTTTGLALNPPGAVTAADGSTSLPGSLSSSPAGSKVRRRFNSASNFARLKTVDLSGNYLGPKGLQALTDTLTAASDVEVLNLTNCLLTDKDIDALVPFFIRPTCKLHTLICDSNELSHAGGRLLVELARARPQFICITAERNRIKQSVMDRLAHQCRLNRELGMQQQNNTSANRNV